MSHKELSGLLNLGERNFFLKFISSASIDPLPVNREDPVTSW